MKMTKKLVLAAAALPLVFGTASAYAFGGKGEHKDMRGKCGGFDKKIIRQLDLTDEQQEQFKEMRKAGREEMKGKRGEHFADMQAHQAKVQELVLADNFDEAAANELAQQMVEKQSERRVAMLKKQHQMMSILTAEQKEQLKELQQERFQKCSDKMAERMEKHQS